jgi:hypothetical protein
VLFQGYNDSIYNLVYFLKVHSTPVVLVKSLRHMGGSECIDPLILKLCNWWEWLVSSTAWPL